jgi:ABC-2 type transport system ATP-binding protein
MPENAIRFDKVGKRYGGQPVLVDVNLAVQAGESLGLVGVNGAGKSTMIKCLLDFVAVNTGSISIFGIPSTQPAARRPLSYLPEKFIPPYYLTARSFLQYMARLHDVDYEEAGVERILARVDFEAAALAKPVRQLSKGMSQKLGLAACLLSGRRLLVLDEPMSGLDPRARASVKQHLLGLRREGRTLFFSTHLLADVEALCDRVAILHGGRVRFVGTPAECCARFGCDDLEQAYLACVGEE